MPESESISTGELGRAVALIRGDISTLTAALATRPDKEDLRRAEDSLVARQLAAEKLQDLKNELQDKAISALEDANRWVIRTVGAALVTALGTAVVVAVRVAGA